MKQTLIIICLIFILGYSLTKTLFGSIVVVFLIMGISTILFIIAELIDKYRKIYR